MPHVLALAVCAAFYPTLLAGVIVILAQPEPRRQLAAFYAGGMTMSLAAGLALLFLLDGSFRDPGSPASAGVDLVAGLLTLLAAWAIGTGRVARLPRPRPRRASAAATGVAGGSRLQRTLARGSITLAFAVGLVLNLPGIWYLAALKQIATDQHGPAADVALVVLFNVIMFALVEIPLAGYLVAPQRTAAAVRAFDAWLRAHARGVGLSIAVTVGVYLVVKGLAEALG